MRLDEIYPFLPLLVTSVYCALGVIYVWITMNWNVLIDNYSLKALKMKWDVNGEVLTLVADFHILFKSCAWDALQSADCVSAWFVIALGIDFLPLLKCSNFKLRLFSIAGMTQHFIICYRKHLFCYCSWGHGLIREWSRTFWLLKNFFFEYFILLTYRLIWRKLNVVFNLSVFWMKSRMYFESITLERNPFLNVLWTQG